MPTASARRRKGPCRWEAELVKAPEPDQPRAPERPQAPERREMPEQPQAPALPRGPTPGW